MLDLLQDEGECYQDDQWRLVITEKRSMLEVVRARLVHRFGDVDGTATVVDDVEDVSPQIFLQKLTVLYTTKGHTNRISRVREIFTSIQPFVVAVNTLVQGEMVAALVWGSLSLIFLVRARPPWH